MTTTTRLPTSNCRRDYFEDTDTFDYPEWLRSEGTEQGFIGTVHLDHLRQVTKEYDKDVRGQEIFECHFYILE
jgi:hypothetical protein